MMLMMGVGGALQRFVSDRFLIEKFIVAEIILAIIGGYAAIALFAAYGFMEDHFELVLYGLSASIGFLIGLELPLALRINERYNSELSGNIAPIFALDYIGSFVGAILWTKVLLKTFPLSEIGFLLAGVNLGVAGVVFAYFVWQRRIKLNWGLLGLWLLGATALGVGYSQNRGWNVSIEQRLYEDPIVLGETTRYQRIVLTHNRALDDFRLYLNGNLQFSSIDEKRYHEMLVHPAMSAVVSPRKVLILGGGDGLALREILKYPSVEQVTLVDLDPAMIQLASTDATLRQLNKGAFDDARVHARFAGGIGSAGQKRTIYQETGAVEKNRKGKWQPELQAVATVDVFTIDADRFITQNRELWDAVIIDLPDPTSLELAKLYSREFYGKVRRLLAPEGIVAVQATSPYHAKETYLCTKRTLESAGLRCLPYHTNVPSFGDWGWVAAWKPTATGTPQRLLHPKFVVPTSYISPELFRASLVFGKGDLISRHREVSTLMRPVVLDYYLSEGWKVE